MRKVLLILFIACSLQMNAQCWKMVSGSLYNSFGIKTDGTMWAWGSNSSGGLGIGYDGGMYAAPIQIGTDNNWKMVCGGKGLGRQAAAIKNDGSLWVWGENDEGQLGDGTFVQRESPVQIGVGSTWEMVKCGQNFMFGLKSDGTLWSWGSHGYTGALGNGSADHNYMVQIGTDSNWAYVAAGQNNGFAIKQNGSLWSWGSNTFGIIGTGVEFVTHFTPVQIAGTGWTQVECDAMSAIALKNDGTVWTWGYNADGQLGNGTYTHSNVPQQVAGNDWQQIAATSAGFYAIKNDKTLWAWGSNYEQYLGTGSTDENHPLPIQIGIAQWDSIYTGNTHAFGYQTGTGFFVWGRNYQAQLGAPALPNVVSIPTYVGPYCALSVPDNQTEAFIVYPNPANAVLYLQNTNNKTIESIIITDMLGKQIIDVNENVRQINIANLSGGVYILHILSEGKIHRQKFLKN